MPTRHDRREVAVVGMGIVSPMGIGIDEFSRSLFAGRSGIVDIRGSIVPEDFPVPFAGIVGLPGASALPGERACRFASEATAEALCAASGRLTFDAVVLGTAGSSDFDFARQSLTAREESAIDWSGTYPESPLGAVARVAAHAGHEFLPDARLIPINGACSTGNQAIGLAMERVRSGEWQRVIVGAVESRCTLFNLLDYDMLKTLATDVTRRPAEASRPFSSDRDGFVRSEGAATLILEARESAEARGAEILGFVTGHGCTTDAWHVTDGRPDTLCIRRAMEDAIRDAGIEPEAIDYINAHGTATRMNDRLETEAIKRVFGERADRVPVSSLKSQIGHPAVAAGAIEAVACLLMLQRQVAGPTLNCDGRDPDCDLDYVPHQARPVAMRNVLSNNFAFGGQNSCLCFRCAS